MDSISKINLFLQLHFLIVWTRRHTIFNVISSVMSFRKQYLDNNHIFTCQMAFWSEIMELPGEDHELRWDMEVDEVSIFVSSKTYLSSNGRVLEHRSSLDLYAAKSRQRRTFWYNAYRIRSVDFGRISRSFVFAIHLISLLDILYLIVEVCHRHSFGNKVFTIIRTTNVKNSIHQDCSRLTNFVWIFSHVRLSGSWKSRQLTPYEIILVGLSRDVIINTIHNVFRCSSITDWSSRTSWIIKSQVNYSLIHYGKCPDMKYIHSILIIHYTYKSTRCVSLSFWNHILHVFVIELDMKW